ncbi:ABC-type proline/glycine betaine transport system permease subunit [Puniceicoccus vermicola]|uniref:ABC transporter permease subunit n=1 Tax=Puniceicoccus vermicola TaxID=388746 RepID=A0A7X1AXX7_9BACT|nr:ABC transporter permease subunit [Puniceicoccus vermicola]MBC2602011.1 ABC transporter permease subunit [Puniceicoccus vermicola]
MINIPIGEYFELMVRWLKSSFSAFFDGISTVLDFPIQVVESTLLLETEGLYPSILFGILLAIVAGFLGRRLWGGKAFLPMFLALALVFGGAEFWRLRTLSSEVTPELAASMEKEFNTMLGSLEESAPEDFSGAETVLENIRDAVPENDDRDSAEYQVRDAAGDGLRDIRRARSAEYDEVFDALDETSEALAEHLVEISESNLSALENERERYESLTLIEESERLIDDLQEVVEDGEGGLLNGFINHRSYSEIRELLTVTQAYYAEQGKDQIADEAKAVDKSMALLNPDRLQWFAPVATTVLMAMIAFLIAGGGMTVFTIVGCFLIISMNLWIPTIESLALVLCATFFALLIGVPAGIMGARSKIAAKIIRPVLDFMQTMPAFVYLIPAVIFFGLGKVPGSIATLVFAMPPAVRLTSLGIRQVPEEVVEAAQAFGSTGKQLLFKAQLPIAMPTILAGVNQTIMLSLSMVVIAGMIGAGGLGEVVLSGITQMKLGLGFEGGLAVVILAIYLDRVTQALGTPKT